VELGKERALADAGLVDGLGSDGRCWRHATTLGLSKDSALLRASWQFGVIDNCLAHGGADVQGDNEEAPHVHVDGARTSLSLRSECGRW
jgi:hypothetical protein